MSPLKPWIENLFFRASKFSCAFSSLGNFWDQATVCEPFTGAIGDKKLFPCKEMGRPICLNAYIHCVSECNPVGPRCVLMSQLNPRTGLVRVLELGAGFRNLLHLAAAGSWPLGQGTWHVKNAELPWQVLKCFQNVKLFLLAHRVNTTVFNGSMMIFLDGQNVSCVTNGYKCENNMNNLTFRLIPWNPSQLGTTTRPVQHVPACSAEVPWFTSEPGPSITWLIACAGTNQHEQYEHYQGQLLEM